jgi:hypothetical protein
MFKSKTENASSHFKTANIYVKLNTKKTKKCSHRDDAEMILLILGYFHEWGLLKKARRKISGILVLPNDKYLDKYLTNYNIIKHN